LSTRDTVALETPARAAISTIVNLPITTPRGRNRFTKPVSSSYTIEFSLASAAFGGVPLSERVDLYRHVALFKFWRSACAEMVAGIKTAFRAGLLSAKVFEWRRNANREALNDGSPTASSPSLAGPEGRDHCLSHPGPLAFCSASSPPISSRRVWSISPPTTEALRVRARL
jgi:hypothetical protein